MKIHPNSNPKQVIISQLRQLLYKWKWRPPKSIKLFKSIEFSCWVITAKILRHDIPIIFNIHNSKLNINITLSKISLDSVTAEGLYNNYSYLFKHEQEEIVYTYN